MIPRCHSRLRAFRSQFNRKQAEKLRVRIVHSPSKAGRGVAFLKLARAKRGRWLVLNEFAKYAFCGLKRKRRDFERSVLKYVSIKSSALTHSGCKSRVCVNALDRLYPAAKLSLPFSFTSPCHRTASRQNGCNPWGNSPRNHRNWCNSPHPASCA